MIVVNGKGNMTVNQKRYILLDITQGGDCLFTVYEVTELDYTHQDAVKKRHLYGVTYRSPSITRVLDRVKQLERRFGCNITVCDNVKAIHQIQVLHSPNLIVS